MKLLKNSPNLWKKKFPWKIKSSNKYSRGRVLILGGQKNMIGATILAAEACLRVGVGSIKIICTKETLPILSDKFPSSLKVEINNFSFLKSFLQKEKKITNVALVGPGAGNNSKTLKFTEEILKQIKYVIIDADSINSFKNKTKNLLKYLDQNKIITPHEGEFHRLFPKIKKKLSNKDKVLKFLKLTKSNILLKGSTTVIGSPKKIIISHHSTSELAVIGSGDVLAGILASLVGDNKMKMYEAASAASWIHGNIAKKFGRGLISEDLIKGIQKSLNELKK
ncbi:MAG: NAD(P)H-hydrate dehydratase [Candidatus Marinimicrobia bacterium]|nr:NAD(P)H-hydrate dehydratase [Candidatus Neomarinimicrobiota bacterium]|tara:strand:+ start:547 stop:1386 length:840 start_codon:yes stop_codon:yes gene_type:complete